MCIAQVLYDFIRTVPCVTLVGAGLSITGSVLALTERSGLDKALILLHQDKAAEFTEYFWWIFIFTLIVNGFAIAIAIPASGVLREFCFHKTDSGCGQFLQCFLGRFSISVCFTLCGVCFLLHFAACCALLPAISLLSLVLAACKAGQDSVLGIAQALKLSDYLGGFHISSTISGFCQVNKLATKTGYSTTIGAILCVLGQVVLLVAMTNLFVRVSLQPQLSLHEEAPEDEEGYGAAMPLNEEAQAKRRYRSPP